jgi:hypothetical protein
MLASSTPPPDPYAPPSNPYAPPSNPYSTPSTDYGAGAPPPSNPYTIPPASPYGAPSANPYGTPSSPGYNPPPGGFGAPVAPYGQPPYIPQPPTKKGPNGCVIAAIIVVAIVVLIGGGIIAVAAIAAHQVTQNFNGTMTSINATATADMGTANAYLTPTTGTGSNTGTTPTTGTGTTPTTSSGVPTSNQIDPNAEANLSNAQTTSSVDSNYKPTNITSNFSVGATIYVTYTLSGKAGYFIEKTYDSNGTIALQSQTPHAIASGDGNGEVSFSLSSSGSYTTGLYWCQQSNCSDAALAQVVTFTVS